MSRRPGRHYQALCLAIAVDYRTLVSCPGNKLRIADTGFDLMGGLGPDEGLGGLIPVVEEVGDGAFQLGDAGGAATANRLLADDAEPALDQVEPGGAGRGEVQMEARMLV